MTLSVWRYSHLALAVSSFLFITIAAITGIVLAFEPIQTEWKQKAIPTAEQFTVAETIGVLQENYLEILSLSVTKNNRVQASVITDEGDVEDFFINPQTAEKVAPIPETSKLYQFAKTLHRSLFLKSTGRFFIALTSFLLFLISISGLILIIKRQQGFKQFFNRILKDNFWQHAHTYLGRVSLIPIVLITLTGVWLSLYQFQVFQHATLQHTTEAVLNTTENLDVADFPILKSIPLSEVISIDFPFSTDAEDFYQLNLKDREIQVNQYTGAVVSEQLYPFTELAYQWSLNTHTGETNAIWAFILLLSTVSILFFIVSGFKLTFKRRKGLIKNKFKASESTHVILVGSETGSTFPFAIWLQKQLLNAGKKVYVAEMNSYESYPKLEQLLILTATYGLGEAPANANQFLQKFQHIPQSKFAYAIIGFGSFAYADYCQFAYDVEKAFINEANAKPLLHTHTINNRSVESFNQWLLQYGQITGFHPDAYQATTRNSGKSKKKNFTVVSKTLIQESHQTFLIELATAKPKKIESGDLLAIAPTLDTHDRLYSVGKSANGNILLSIKLHAKGICSNYLNNLVIGETLQASRIKNKEFYFPKQAYNVVMIATGTGIAPFLGMLQENSKKIPTYLYWGAQDNTAFEPFAPHINPTIADKKLTKFIPVYSRATATKVYVQDKIETNPEFFAETFTKGGVVMICGSVAMQKSVLEVLATVCKHYCPKDLSYYQKKHQLVMDCY